TLGGDPPPSDLVLDPLTPTTLYVGIFGGGVFKSTDGGSSWTAVNTGLIDLRVLSLALDPRTPTTLYAGLDFPRVFKCTDGASSWTAAHTGLPPNTSILAFAVVPLMPTFLYAGASCLHVTVPCQGGVFKSIDGGSSWRAMNTGLTSLNVRALVLDLL